MTKHKSKKAKLERTKGWEEIEEKCNTNNFTASSVQGEEYEPTSSYANHIHSHVFTQEVKAMLYAYGDVRHPLVETSRLVEEIVHTQICQVLKAAAEVAGTRSSPDLGLEEFLFLLRKDHGKLSRFVKRMKFLDSHSKLVAGSSTEVKTEELDDLDEEIAFTSEESKIFKRWIICIDFLSHIDETGELKRAALLPGNDDVKTKRLERAEEQTREMSSAEYMEYVKCRQITFASQQGSGKAKFKEWFDLEALGIETVVSKFGWDAIEYLAQETVAELVDLALLVRSETMPPLLPCEAEPDARHLPLYASSSLVARAEVLSSSHKTGESTGVDPGDLGARESGETARRKRSNEGSLNRKLAIKPSHIREAMRRFNYNTMKSFLSRAVTVSQTSQATKLLCLP